MQDCSTSPAKSWKSVGTCGNPMGIVCSPPTKKCAKSATPSAAPRFASYALANQHQPLRLKIPPEGFLAEFSEDRRRFKYPP